MILNGDQILYRLLCGEIRISPVNHDKIGPNSYDVHLGRFIKRIKPIRTIRTSNLKDVEYETFDLAEKPYILNPDDFILGCTNEYCENHAKDLVPMIEGLSSLGRCGLSIHQTAGFGDIGFCGNWTLELSAKYSIEICAGMRIGQLYWHKCEPSYRKYKGRYQNQVGTTCAKDS